MRRALRSLGVIASFFILIIYTSYISIMNTTYANIWIHQRAPVQATFSNLHRQYSRNRTLEDSVLWNHDGYCVISISTGIEDERDAKGIEGVTLCTQGTPEFLHHIREQCNRWRGPISSVVYTSEEYLHLTQDMIQKLINCDSCVKKWVAWYAFYKNISGCSHTLKRPKWNTPDCGNLVFSHVLGKKLIPYPINVARNIARMSSRTTFVLSLDIELYPNRDIAPRFLRMESRLSNHSRGPQVWVLPVFEVPLTIKPPLQKKELRRLFENGTAVSFHKFRCDMCHKIPHLKEWMKKDGNDRELRIAETVKRNVAHRLQFWEPFFIGTKEDPLFDPRLSWNGKRNKMQVAYEMCLMNYDFHILDDAFLVHSPGINRYNASKEKIKAKYIVQNNRIFRSIENNLNKKYLNVTGC